jgi:transcriptional regulator with XRE-family HTH domain
MTTFGELIRAYRLRAGLGLRSFATLIEQRASIVSAVEAGGRAPWRSEATLERVAEVLGLAESSSLWQKIVQLSKADSPALPEGRASGRLTWWWSSTEVATLDTASLGELATFVGTELQLEPCTPPAPAPLTELAIEWRVRHLLGRHEANRIAAPVDVEAVLENQAGVRLVILPGLIPRFSVQACATVDATGITLFVDRIVADSQPIASYRQLLALCFAPAALWQADAQTSASSFWQLRSGDHWPCQLRNSQRFALALLLPANPVLASAETAYQQLIGQQGWIETGDANRALRNRLAEQFAVPTALVHRRLVGWPCHLYERVAQALSAQEPTLPPLDWIVEQAPPRQQTLFDLKR